MFAELRRAAIPEDDIRFLLEAGYTEAETEILVAVAIHEARAHEFGGDISRQLDHAAEVFNASLEKLERTNEEPSEPKKRKTFNGIGKVLGGSITGLGNALMAAGTILAPNPATAAGSIASAAVAITAIFSGIGDLRGE